MKMKIEIKSIAGKVLFELEKENNTVKDTLISAIKEGANLEFANLEFAYLGSANLEFANLEGAYLGGANLEGAYLEGADLKGADLRHADLKGANLKGANLEFAYLRYADLKGANLEGAYLEGAYLRYANLKGAYLKGANLFQVSGIGSAGRTTTYDLKNDKVICGCFYGSLNDFEIECKKTYPSGIHNIEYLSAISFFKSIKESRA